MCSLEGFNSLPPPGCITVCERNGELVFVREKDTNMISTYTQNLNYPDVDTSLDFLSTTLSKETARSAFLEHDETLQKRLLHAWYEHGLTGILEELSSMDDRNTYLSWIRNISSKLLASVRWTSSLHGSLFPHLSMSNEELVSMFSQNLHWQESEVRAFAWHPHIVKYAVALRDDSIKVFSSGRNSIVPILKHKLQKGISQISWKPMSASVLAVSCYTCVLIWHVDPTSLATRPSTSCVQVLSVTGHSPVTSISWDPKGAKLISSSPADTAIMIWDIGTECNVPLRRLGGGGVSHVSWSPDGSKVLAACPSPIFRVWETRSWTCEKWSKLLNRCQATCWSPDGSILLFTTVDDPTIYSLTFDSAPAEKYSFVGGSTLAVACVDLTETYMQINDQTIKIGGAVHGMVWDPKGERLAVSFKGKQNSFIALFQTRIKPVLQVIPCGMISGGTDVCPDLIYFKPTFDEGALLTVVWSNGKIAFIPLYFMSRDTMDESKYINSNLNGSLMSSSRFTNN